MNRTLSQANEYATSDDFQELFDSELADLFRLAFLLTADADKAEHCLVLSLHECVAHRFVFKRWLPVWGRNAVIQNAVRIVTANQVCPLRETTRRQALSRIHTSALDALNHTDEWAAILYLSDFDRLVHVICTLESYTTRDCAVFLGRSRREIQNAQNRAKAEIAAFEHEWLQISDGLSPEVQLPLQSAAQGPDQAFGTVSLRF
jgi:DNA-directed RNA polymerase specialized sigma24 family protein